MLRSSSTSDFIHVIGYTWLIWGDLWSIVTIFMNLHMTYTAWMSETWRHFPLTLWWMDQKKDLGGGPIAQKNDILKSLFISQLTVTIHCIRFGEIYNSDCVFFLFVKWSNCYIATSSTYCYNRTNMWIHMVDKVWSAQLAYSPFIAVTKDEEMWEKSSFKLSCHRLASASWQKRRDSLCLCKYCAFPPGRVPQTTVEQHCFNSCYSITSPTQLNFSASVFFSVGHDVIVRWGGVGCRNLNVKIAHTICTKRLQKKVTQ